MEGDEEKRNRDRLRMEMEEQEQEWQKKGTEDAKELVKIASGKDLLKIKWELENRYRIANWMNHLPEAAMNQFEDFCTENREGEKVYTDAWAETMEIEIERIEQEKAKKKEPDSKSLCDWLR